MAMTDGELVRRTREGDREAFGALVDRYRDMAYGLGYHLTGDFEAARDLAQEAFVQAYLRLGQLREPEKFAGWLRRIAVNVHRMSCRRKEVRTVALDEEAQPSRGEHQPSEIEVVVREALGKLREPERLALTLHYVNGYSHGEIGDFLGVRAETVKTRLARARKHLREEVMQMVEDVFEEKALPPEFREDVVKAVDGMVDSIRSVLPGNLGEIRERMRTECNWPDILSRLPAPWGRPLEEQGQAPQIRVADLPADLQEDVKKAVCLTWFDFMVREVTDTLPWISDFDTLWIRFYEEDGRPHVWLANVPGDTGTIHNMGYHPDDYPAQAECLDESTLEVLPMPGELREILRGLQAAGPKPPGSLRHALYLEMATLLEEVRNSLPATARERMGAGERVSVRDLPERLRGSLRRAMALYWGTMVLTAVERLPSYVGHLDAIRIEFGLYPRHLAFEWAGKPYVKLYGPEKDRSTMQTALAEACDAVNGASVRL